MTLDWHGALDAVIHHPLFGIGITLAAYQLVLAAYEKTRWIFLQPVLVSMLVVIGVLMIVIVRNPLNPFSSDSVVLVENPGKADMRITIKDGEELTRYESSGQIGEGQGVKAGITYKLPDGRMVYVPE